MIRWFGENKDKETDYAYIAGLLDGEGTIHVTKESLKHPSLLSVRIRNNNRQVLEWTQSIAGQGKIYTDRRRIPNTYSLEFASNKAVNFLKLLLPYLKIKKEQAELAFKFQERVIKGRRQGNPLTDKEKGKRRTIYSLMKQLNHPILNASV